MALSNDIVSQFAKLVKPEENKIKSETLNGTYKNIDGVEYVQLDGSDVLTPVTSMVEAETGERVKVEIKDHNATVTGNISSPMARSKSVNDIKDEVDEFGNSIKQMDNTIQQQNNSIQQMENSIKEVGDTINSFQNTIDIQNNTIQQFDNTIKEQNDRIDSMDNDIKSWGNTIDSMNNTITEQGDNIKSMNNTITEINNTIDQQNNTIEQYGNQIEQFGNKFEQVDNTIEQQGNLIQQHDSSIRQAETDIDTLRSRVEVHDSDITILNSAFTIKDGVLEGLDAVIVNQLMSQTLDTHYAKIDFTNIGIAAIEKLFTDSGIIGDLVVKDQHITGKLVGVTIIGDLIEAGTIKADKLVVQGEDGLYYKLNVSGETVSGQQTDYNSLNGKVITAKSITAEKITVEDLVAFGATIGGFTIGKDSIHTNVKGDINTDANGLYFDNTGQMYLGDLSNHVKYYKDTNEETGEESYILDITAATLRLGGSQKTINETLDEQTEKNVEFQNNIRDNKTSIDKTREDLTNDINDTKDDLNEAKQQFMSEIDMVNGTIVRMMTSITNTFKTTGGNNLLRNSVGYSTRKDADSGAIIIDFWEHTGNVSTSQDDAMSVSGSEFIFTGPSTLQQAFNTIPNTTYSISFNYKHQVVGTAGTLKMELLNEKEGDKLVCQIVNAASEWTHFSLGDDLYVAGVTHPTLKISVDDPTGNDIFEITDLIIANGEVEVWSGYSDEVYGKEHKLDKNGLRLSNLTSGDYAQMTATDLTFSHIENDGKQTETITSVLNKDRVFSNSGEFTNKFSIGKLMTVVLDEDDIIEYI